MTLERIWNRLDIAIHNCMKAQVCQGEQIWYELEEYFQGGIELIEDLMEQK